MMSDTFNEPVPTPHSNTFMTVLLSRALLALSLVFAIGLIQSCESPCSLPTERSPQIRILNAMPDQPFINIYIDGKPFLTNYPFAPSASFGYYNKFRDSSFLLVGHRTFVVTSLTAGIVDTVLDTSITLSDHRQTIIFGGLGMDCTAPHSTYALLLDDDAQLPDPEKTLLRFVHAVPDLDNLDIYFKNVASGTPDVTVKKGNAVGYLTLPPNPTGVTITKSGDPTNVIFSVGGQFLAKGLLATIVVRGLSKPSGKEAIASPIVLLDPASNNGRYLINFITFGVRLINGVHPNKTLPLVLLPKGPLDAGPRNDLANQQTVYRIESGMVSSYLPLNWGIHGSSSTKWFIGVDSTFMFRHTSPTDSVFAPLYIDSTTFPQQGINPTDSNGRYSIILLDTTRMTDNDTTRAIWVIRDTVGSPTACNMGRIRIIDLISPYDHNTVTVTPPDGSTHTMRQKDFFTFDDIVGHTVSITVSDGAASKSISVTIKDGIPQTVFLLPASPTDAFPYTVTDQ